MATRFPVTTPLARALTVLRLAGACGARAQPPSFRGLGDLPGGAFASWVMGIAPDASAVVGMSIGAQAEAVLWSGGATRSLGVLVPDPSAWSEAWAASSGGAVVAGMSFHPASTFWGRAFRWTQETGMVGLGVLAGATQSRAFAISGDGSVIVGDSGPRAFRWTSSGGMVALPIPARYAWSTSADGSLVTGEGSADSGAYLWSEATGLVVLPLPVGASQCAGAVISPDGTVVVGYARSANGQEAFRWTAAEGSIGLGDLPGGAFRSQAWGASSQGAVVIGQATTGAGTVPMIWDRARGMRELRTVLEQEFGLGAAIAGWTLAQVNGISADGRVLVGDGTNPAGQAEGWIAALTYACYANCDSSTAPPILNVADFSCFLNRFSAGDPYANCDDSTLPPVLNVRDFVCFLNRFAAGCT